MSILKWSLLIYLASLAWLCYGSDGYSPSFPVYRSFHCLFETGMPGVLKIMVVPYRRTPLQRLRYYEPTFMAYANFRFQQIEILVLCLELHCSYRGVWESGQLFRIPRFLLLLEGKCHPLRYDLRIPDSFRSGLHRLGLEFRWNMTKVSRTSSNDGCFLLTWTSHALHDCTH